MTATFLDKLTTRQNQRAEKQAAEYRKLVIAAAKGQEPDASKADQLLADLGKTVDELKSDIARRVERDSRKALFAKLPEIEREISAINEKRAEATRIFAAAEVAYETTMDPLNCEYEDSCRLQTDALRAGDELVNSCDDPELIRERDGIDAEISRIASTLPRLRERAETSERSSNAYRQRVKTEITLEADKRNIEALAERYRVEAENFRVEVRKLEREATALQKRRDALRLKMQQS
jgi:hypothetical protein